LLLTDDFLADVCLWGIINAQINALVTLPEGTIHTDKNDKELSSTRTRGLITAAGSSLNQKLMFKK